MSPLAAKASRATAARPPSFPTRLMANAFLRISCVRKSTSPKPSWRSYSILLHIVLRRSVHISGDAVVASTSTSVTSINSRSRRAKSTKHCDASGISPSSRCGRSSLRRNHTNIATALPCIPRTVLSDFTGAMNIILSTSSDVLSRCRK